LKHNIINNFINKFLVPGDAKTSSGEGPNVTEMHLKTLTNTAPHLLPPSQLLAPHLAPHLFLGPQVLSCPLCAETFTDKLKVQKHLTTIHNVNSEGLQKLLDLVADPDDQKSRMPPSMISDLMRHPHSSMKIAKMVEVDLDLLDAEWTKLATEDGRCITR